MIENEFAILMPRRPMPPSSDPRPPHRASALVQRTSLLMQGAGQRLAAACLGLVLLWGAVAWALQGVAG